MMWTNKKIKNLPSNKTTKTLAHICSCINFTHSLKDGEEERVPKGEIESSILENRGIPSSYKIYNTYYEYKFSN